jgi:short-subunit dehydrogenase
MTEAPPMPTAWLVLAASSSVSRAFARLAAAEGASVILAGRDLDDLEATAADIRIRTGRPAAVLPFDAADIEGHAAFVDRCWAEAGERRLSVFSACGTMPDQAAIDADFSLAERTVVANYTGVMSVLSRLAPGLERQRGGQVVVLGSVAGDRGRKKNYVYGSAKAGLHAYLQGLAARLHAAGVAVVTVKPGFLDTAMTYGLPGMFLVASPEACARACLRAARRGGGTVYFPGFWRVIMAIIRAIPDALFKRLSI